MSLADLRPIDTEIYRNRLLQWLPAKMFDVHVHLGLAEHSNIDEAHKAANWALEVGIEQSWSDLQSNYKSMFPYQEHFALVFGGVFRDIDIEANNEYVLSGAKADPSHYSALMVTLPEWDEAKVRHGLASGYKGFKPYPDLALCGAASAGIYDFIPVHHLKALDDNSAILMLHLPRADRLGDADNIRELLEISEKYPDIKIIVAHVGRSFCLPTALKGLPHFRECPNVYFDISANLNAQVFEFAIQTVGVDRILYGSDLPILLMHGNREHTGEKYINYTDGNYSWNTNRRSPQEEDRYTFFLYEEILALIQACENLGIDKRAFERILFSNAYKLVNEAGACEGTVL